MPTVLLTRPRVASKNLAQELARHDYTCVIEPLLTIIPTAASPHDIKNIQAVMITSANALEALDYDQAVAFLDLPCFCVGSRTADKAKVFGFGQTYNVASDGIELAKLIGSKCRSDGGPILHISGRDIDSKAQDELCRMDFAVAAWVAYEAVPMANFAEQTIALFEQGGLDAVLVYSVRTAETLKTLLAQHRLNACCERLIAIGLSAAIADVLKPLPWRKCVSAAAPTEDAMIACLKQNLPVS